MLLFCRTVSVCENPASLWLEAQDDILESIWISVSTIFFVLDSAIDQSYRGLVSTPKKASYKESFEENVAVRETLSNNNILPGDKIAVIGSPPFQWARMGGLRITGEILYQAEFLRGDSVQRSMAIESLRRAEYRAVIAIGQEYERLQPEGWSKILGTRDFHVYLF